MRLIVDAMGGDNAPGEIIKGCIEALKEYKINITLVGKEDNIKSILIRENINTDNIEVVDADEVIQNDEAPTTAIRKKKNSSMVVGLRLLKEGKGDAFISAGSTGALLAGGLFIVGRIKGIDRPALAPVLPGKNGPFMLIDAGANAECKVKNILQFALMGDIYSKKILNKLNPKIALVNIGSEEEKGTEFTKACYSELKNQAFNFVGNIEGREIPLGDTDVVVCDGFSGNLILKMYEGVAGTVFDILKKEIMSSIRTKIGGMLLKPAFKVFKNKFDYTEYGGAILLGINGTVIKAHGSSNANAIKNAIRQAIKCSENQIVECIKDNIQNDMNSD